MNNWIVSVKVFLISAGAVALAVGLRLLVPVAVNEIPAMCSAVLSWLKPPYLYIIINGIIITIAASSRFHHSAQSEPARSEHNLISVKTPPSGFASMTAPPEIRTIIEESTVVFEDQAVEFMKPVVDNGLADIETVEEEKEVVVAYDSEEADRAEAEDVFVESNLSYNDNNHIKMPPQEIISPVPYDDHFQNLLPVRENKPLVLSRFGNRKPIRTTPHEGGLGVRALRVARPKKHETLESTWKMITEGRHVPLTRHLKKSDTFEQHQHHARRVDHVPKSETFKDRTNYELPPVQRIRKEPSLGQDELNRRVEAFIKKFNEDMRMQRQESLNRYMEMINRGV